MREVGCKTRLNEAPVFVVLLVPTYTTGSLDIYGSLSGTLDAL